MRCLYLDTYSSGVPHSCSSLDLELGKRYLDADGEVELQPNCSRSCRLTNGCISDFQTQPLLWCTCFGVFTSALIQVSAWCHCRERQNGVIQQTARFHMCVCLWYYVFSTTDAQLFLHLLLNGGTFNANDQSGLFPIRKVQHSINLEPCDPWQDQTDGRMFPCSFNYKHSMPLKAVNCNKIGLVLLHLRSTF